MRANGDIVMYTSNLEPDSVVLPAAPMFGDFYTKKGRKSERHTFQVLTQVGGRKYGGAIVDGITNNEISNRMAISIGASIWHRSQGGDFVTNDWQGRIPAFQNRVNNFQNLKSIYQQMVPSDDRRIRGDVSYILRKADHISEEHFDKERAVMINTAKQLNDQQIKLLGMAFLDASAADFDEKCAELEDVFTESANKIASHMVIEKIGKIMDKPFVCTDCMQGISTKSNLLKHIKSAHKQNVDLPEQEERINAMVIRAVEKKQETHDRQMRQKNEELELMRQQLQLSQAALVAQIENNGRDRRSLN